MLKDPMATYVSVAPSGNTAQQRSRSLPGEDAKGAAARTIRAFDEGHCLVALIPAVVVGLHMPSCVVRAEQAPGERKGRERGVGCLQPGDAALLAHAGADSHIVVPIAHLYRARRVAEARPGAVERGCEDFGRVRPRHARAQAAAAAAAWHLPHQPERAPRRREQGDGALLCEADRAGVAVGKRVAVRCGLVLCRPAQQVLGCQVAPAAVANVVGVAGRVGEDVPGLRRGLVRRAARVVMALDGVVPAAAALSAPVGGFPRRPPPLPHTRAPRSGECWAWGRTRGTTRWGPAGEGRRWRRPPSPRTTASVSLTLSAAALGEEGWVSTRDRPGLAGVKLGAGGVLLGRG